MKNILAKTAVVLTAGMPFLALALPPNDVVGGKNVGSDNLADLIGQINAVINTIIPFLVGLAVLVIIWGVFNYIAGAGDEEKRAEAKTYIVWGVVGVFIMLSIWGLVNVLVNSFALRKGPLNSAQLPDFGTGKELTPARIGDI